MPLRPTGSGTPRPVASLSRPRRRKRLPQPPVPVAPSCIGLTVGGHRYAILQQEPSALLQWRPVQINCRAMSSAWTFAPAPMMPSAATPTRIGLVRRPR